MVWCIRIGALVGLLAVWSCASEGPAGSGGDGSSTGADVGVDAESMDTGSSAADTLDNDVDEAFMDTEVDLGRADVFIADPFACTPVAEVCDGLDNDCNGLVDDAACPCSDATVCYGGPVQTRGVGACRDGARVCAESGEFFEECLGWQGPEEELCADGLDNNCNGVLDEEPCVEICEAGELRPCWPGEAAQDGVGACQPGVERCDPETGRWRACEDAVLPREEVCEDEADNDCDGFVNEVCCLAEELCGDGEDTDCDGELDEGCPEAIADGFVVGELAESRAMDMVLVVDNSDSMTDTVAAVEGNLTALGTRMVGQGIDYRVTMIAKRGADPEGPDVCIAEPLAGPGCGNAERFLHLDRVIGSHSAYEDVLACEQGCAEGNFRDFLRVGSLLQVVVVTDDESDLRWSQFRDAMVERGLGGFVLHAVVGLRLGGCALGVGNRYVDGALETDGALLHVCDNDWGEVIDVIFDATVTRLQGSFVLSRQPIVSTIRVFAGPVVGMEEEQLGNWSYNAEGNRIDFMAGLAPPLGHRVVVQYQSDGE